MKKLLKSMDSAPHAKEVFWKFHWILKRSLPGHSGVDIMDTEWDNLIILDGCRYDIFEQVCSIEGELKKKVSKGSTTAQFLKNNFKKEEYRDTIYISANPHVKIHGVDQKFVDRYRLWETQWDDELSTVHPKDMTEKILEVYDKYPKKRYIAHYIQPHYPFIGESGQNISHSSLEADGLLPESEAESVWKQLENGNISYRKVWSAYKENLELTLPYISELVEELDGLSVITSDHGNSMGRFGIYGHPGNRDIKELTKIPWLIIDGDRREIIESNRNNMNSSEQVDDNIEDRLRSLGYA